MKQRGFTAIEMVVVIAFLILAGALFFMQTNNLQIATRDDKRKTAINAMYYGLEEAFYKQNNFYPETIGVNNLPTVEPSLFTDPSGVKIGQTAKGSGEESVPVQSDYRYEPTNCVNQRCKSYILGTTLEGEADYVKKSRNS